MIILILVIILLFIGASLFMILTNETKKNHESRTLKGTVEKLESEMHYNKQVMLVNDLMFNRLEKEFKDLQKRNEGEALDSLWRLFSDFKKFSNECVDDDRFANIQIDMKLALISWESLRLLLQWFMHEAKEHNIRFIVNDWADWQQLAIPELSLVRLVGNLMSNALKELKKTSHETKYVSLNFEMDRSGVFTIEIHDNAHEFPVEILAHLGKGRISINGTGNGYVEIFEILDEEKASFEIDELILQNIPYKRIKVAFNRLQEKRIRSGYRTNELLFEIGFR